VDAVTASEASAQKTTSRISLRTTGKRVILPIHIALETVSLIRGLLSRYDACYQLDCGSRFLAWAIFVLLLVRSSNQCTIVHGDGGWIGNIA
jgi:hypothetical protein